jgi:phage terminase large subunit
MRGSKALTMRPPKKTSSQPRRNLRRGSGRNRSKFDPYWPDLYYDPFEQQQKFHASNEKYRLFGGAAGPGKSTALLWEAIRQANRVPGSDTLLLRRTYPELESSLISQFKRTVPRDKYRKFNESKRVVNWLNGSTTRFGYCRNESDVYRYQGAEFLFIGLDELTHFSLKQWQFLTSRNRCPVKSYLGKDGHTKPVVPTMAGATNPGNIGHAWVKALWVDHQPPAGFDRADLYNPADYAFIRARLADNPIYANDAEYRRTLEALPEHLRKAFLDGDWNVFAGQYFDIFDYGRHTARPEEIRLEPWWPRWISIDWGFQHPSAVYWHCAVPSMNVAREPWPVSRENQKSASSVDFSSTGHGSRNTDHSARIVTYREFAQNGLSPRMLAQGIAERTGRENISEIFLSPDAFAHRTAEASIAEQLGDVFMANGLPRPAPADDDRVGGWQFMYQMLESDAWVITENCAKLIECMPTLVRDTSRVEDIRKMDGDDPADSARYGLVSGGRLAGVGAASLANAGFAPSRAGQAPPLHSRGSGARFVTGMPLGEQIARQVSATDPTSRAIHYERLQSEAQKQFRPKKFPRRRW